MLLLLVAVLAPAVSVSIIKRAAEESCEDRMYCYVYQCLLPDKIYYKRIDFADEETSVAWTEEMESLKARCGQEFGTDAEFLRAKKRWVRDCRQWAEDYGKNIVPNDMRCRINDSERELGYEPTIFGRDEGVFYQSRSGI